MAHVAVVVADGFEDSELDTPRATLLSREHRVTVVGSETGVELHGYQGRVSYTADTGIDELATADVDALVVPGGDSPTALRRDPRMVALVRELVGRGVPVAAIGHGPSLLAAADVVRGRRLTSAPSIAAELRNAGADWVDAHLVEHRDLVTAGAVADLSDFTKALLARLER